MMYRWMMSLAMLAIAGPVLAQDGPSAGRATPAPSSSNRIRVMGPERAYTVLLNRRARLGVNVDLRASGTDSIGALIQSVTPGGPAAKAGIRSGDIITRLDGHSLTDRTGTPSADDGQSLPGLRLIELAARLAPNDTISVDLRRGKDRKSVRLVTADDMTEGFNGDLAAGQVWSRQLGDSTGASVFLRSTPPPGMLFREGPEMDRMVRGQMLPSVNGQYKVFFDSPLSDVELAPLNDDLGSYFGTSDGVLVIAVPKDSRLGLRSGDVVLSVDGRKPGDPSHLMRILQSYDRGESFRLEIMRNHKRDTVTGRLGGDRADSSDR